MLPSLEFEHLTKRGKTDHIQEALNLSGAPRNSRSPDAGPSRPLPRTETTSHISEAMEGIVHTESASSNHSGSSPIDPMNTNHASLFGTGASMGKSLPMTPRAWDSTNQAERTKSYLTVTPQNEATGPRMEEIEDLFSLVGGRGVLSIALTLLTLSTWIANR